MEQRVLANHAHVFPASIRPDGTIEQLIKYLDACQIEQAVCFAPFEVQVKEQNIDRNAWLAAELNHQPRLIGFGTIDFEREDVRQQVIRCHDFGFKGLKIHPNLQRIDILSEQSFEVYDAAQARGMFITFHTGVHRSPLMPTALIRFDEIAWKFPQLRYSLEHVGGYHFFKEALAVIFNHVPAPWEKGKCNVFAGLTSVFNRDHLGFWYLGEERLQELLRQVGPTQLIFGLDFPYNEVRHTLNAIETIRRVFPPTVQSQVLGENLRRELNV